MEAETDNRFRLEPGEGFQWKTRRIGVVRVGWSNDSHGFGMEGSLHLSSIDFSWVVPASGSGSGVVSCLGCSGQSPFRIGLPREGQSLSRQKGFLKVSPHHSIQKIPNLIIG